MLLRDQSVPDGMGRKKRKSLRELWMRSLSRKRSLEHQLDQGYLPFGRRGQQCAPLLPMFCQVGPSTRGFGKCFCNRYSTNRPTKPSTRRDSSTSSTIIASTTTCWNNAANKINRNRASHIWCTTNPATILHSQRPETNPKTNQQLALKRRTC